MVGVKEGKYVSRTGEGAECDGGTRPLIRSRIMKVGKGGLVPKGGEGGADV